MQWILAHERADFDAFASMVVASKLYPGARLVLIGSPEPSLRRFLALHRGVFSVSYAHELKDQRPERIVLVDTRNPARLGPLRNLVSEPQISLHVYDHHPPTPEGVQGDLDVTEPMGAAVTVLLKRLRQKNLALTVEEATLCLLALHEETGSFTHAGTTAEDLAMGAWLMERGARLAMVNVFVGQTLNVAQRQLLSELMETAHVHNLEGTTVALASAEREEFVGDLALLTTRLLEMLGVEVVLTLVRMEDTVYVVGRATSETAQLGHLLGELGGGGHGAAASASIPVEPLNQLEQRLLERLREVLPGKPTARELMTSPVHVLELDHLTVTEAARGLRELGHTAVGLARDGKLVGWIARSDLDKAIAHNLGHAPVTTYMSTEIVSVEPDARLDEIQRLLVERDIGRVPVIERGEMVGIVSRTDVLRWLHSAQAARAQESITVAMPASLEELLRHIGEVAQQEGYEVFLVGGAVRDLLLGRECEQDIDLVVEGPARELADKVAERLGPARVLPHERFRTASVVWPDGRRIDLATARTEIYTRPAALPVVQGSTLKQDLARRDFSVNAMAVRLSSSHFGQLVDYFGARRDLADERIRVLHNHSFLDDPTRILRAVRFEARLGFRLDPATEHLLKQALLEGALEMVSAERLRDELLIILSERDPLPAIERLHKLRILPRLHPSLALSTRVERTMRRVQAVEQEFGRSDPPWLLALLALMSSLKPEETEALRRRFRLQVLPGLEESFRAHRVLRALSSRDLKDSELERLLAPLPREALLWLLAFNASEPLHARIRHYLADLQHLPPVLRGRDLLELGFTPGPLFKEILTRARAVQLDQGLPDPRGWVEQNFGSARNAGIMPDKVERA
ncbi:MAG: poly(A) polymerase [Candidatus Xenobia bacterium]